MKEMEYEIKFEVRNILHGHCETMCGYFNATSQNEAVNKLNWKYGQHVDIIHIEVFSGTNQ